MTDDTRLDAQVRGALIDLPVPDDQRTREALQSVLTRSGRPLLARPARRSWTVPMLVAAAVALLAAATAVIVSRSPQAGPDPSLPSTSAWVGSWWRQASETTEPGWYGRWRMELADDGVLTLIGPVTAADSTEGASYGVTGGTLRVDAFVNSVCNEQAAGTYALTVEEHRLILTLVEDPCPARAQLFSGTWVKSP